MTRPAEGGGRTGRSGGPARNSDPRRRAAPSPLAVGALALLAALATAPAVRPPLPLDTFVPIDDTFPDPAGSCASATRVLSVPSAQYPTIVSAVKVATAGTRVQVAEGTYKEDGNDGDLWYAVKLAVDGVCLAGAGPGRTKIVPGPGFPPATSQKYGLLIEASGVTVADLSVEGFEAVITLGNGNKRQAGVVIRNVAAVGRVSAGAGGIIATPDHRSAKLRRVPVLDGLTLSNVTVTSVEMGVSCNFGPCAHWWLDGVQIFARDPGDGGSGSDAFAVENGRQVVVDRSLFTGAGADGIDVKGSEVVVWRSTVRSVTRNGIKLWQGGDVVDCVVDGTGADTSLAGNAGRFRYLRTSVSGHSPGASAYVGVWGYGSPKPVQLEINACTFRNNSQGGGFYVPGLKATKLKIVGTSFWDVGAKLIDYGRAATLMTTAGGLAELERRGWGSGNQLGP